jgi:hypothetical protein
MTCATASGLARSPRSQAIVVVPLPLATGVYRPIVLTSGQPLTQVSAP